MQKLRRLRTYTVVRGAGTGMLFVGDMSLGGEAAIDGEHLAGD